LYPMIMLVSKQPLEEMRAQVELVRPAKNGMPRMKDDEMTSTIAPTLFTDHNEARSIPLVVPRWSEIFEYYDVRPPRQDYVVVRPARAGEQARHMKDAVSVIDHTAFRAMAEVHYRRRGIYKLPRQGAFDNLHIAPKMAAPTEVRYALDDDELRRSFAEIAMAPFCAHDCLHTHWRWADWAQEKQNLGWEGWTPYCKPGAPMVPPNQEVTITLLEGAGLRYSVRATKIPPRIWQIVFHHGSAYAITWSGLKVFAAETLMSLPSPGSEFSWYGFYWRMRYLYDSRRRGGHIFHEWLVPGGDASLHNPEAARQALEAVRDI